MTEAYICDYLRTPIGRFGGALAAVRTDDLAAIPLARADGAAMPASTGRRSTTSICGCANQAGEDNRNVARMAALLAGLPVGGAGRDDQPALRLGDGCGARRAPARSAAARPIWSSPAASKA